MINMNRDKKDIYIGLGIILIAFVFLLFSSNHNFLSFINLGNAGTGYTSVYITTYAHHNGHIIQTPTHISYLYKYVKRVPIFAYGSIQGDKLVNTSSSGACNTKIHMITTSSYLNPISAKYIQNTYTYPNERKNPIAYCIIHIPSNSRTIWGTMYITTINNKYKFNLNVESSSLYARSSVRISPRIVNLLVPYLKPVIVTTTTIKNTTIKSVIPQYPTFNFNNIINQIKNILNNLLKYFKI